MSGNAPVKLGNISGNTSGPQGNTSGPQGNTPGPQGNTPGTQGNTPGPQGNPPGPQGNTPGTQGNRHGPQGNTPGPQGNTPGPQGNTPGPQGNPPGTQGNTPGTQGNRHGPQGKPTGNAPKIACRSVPLTNNNGSKWEANVKKTRDCSIPEFNFMYIQKLITAPEWNKIKSLQIKKDLLKINLLKKFAVIQDSAFAKEYNQKYEEADSKNSTLLDDLLEIAFIYNAAQEIEQKNFEDLKQNKENFKKLLSASHDAWSYARFIKFNDEFDLESYSEKAGNTLDTNLIPIILDDKFVSKVQLKRLGQLVSFDDLLKRSEEEAMKDVIPLTTYFTIVVDNIEVVKGLHSLIFGNVVGGRKTKKSKVSKSKSKKLVDSKKQSGGCGGGMCGPVATNKRVMVGGKNRVVYSGKRGGEYVKSAGEFIPLNKLKI